MKRKLIIIPDRLSVHHACTEYKLKQSQQCRVSKSQISPFYHLSISYRMWINQDQIQISYSGVPLAGFAVISYSSVFDFPIMLVERWNLFTTGLGALVFRSNPLTQINPANQWLITFQKVLNFKWYH